MDIGVKYMDAYTYSNVITRHTRIQAVNALIGKRLKELRETRGYTQEELAELVNVAVLQIYRWEKEKRDPSADDIARLARILGTTADYLVGVEDAPRERLREEDLSPDERLLVDAYRTGRIREVLRLLADGPEGDVPDEPHISVSKPAI